MVATYSLIVPNFRTSTDRSPMTEGTTRGREGDRLTIAVDRQCVAPLLGR